MEYRKLGEHGPNVSRLCFGTLTMGPLQANLSVAEGASLISRALDKGVNFIDTAQLYNTYHHIAKALQRWHDREKVVIATKTYAYSAEEAALSLEKARQELQRDRIDIFLLHEQETRLTLKGHLPALEYLLEASERGQIGLVGISCHTVEAVNAALDYPGIRVIHPILNIAGLGIKDGTMTEMLDQITRARNQGVGIYSMKPLGGGHLMDSVPEALGFLEAQQVVDAIALGMVSEMEVDFAICFFNGQDIPEKISRSIRKQKRRLKHYHEDCTGCKKCLESCPQNALHWEGKPVADKDNCLFCGYCGAACPAFCMRIY